MRIIHNWTLPGRNSRFHFLQCLRNSEDLLFFFFFSLAQTALSGSFILSDSVTLPTQAVVASERCCNHVVRVQHRFPWPPRNKRPRAVVSPPSPGQICSTAPVWLLNLVFPVCQHR